MAYIFDTNIFIRSKNEMPMDIWPTFWARSNPLYNQQALNTFANVADAYLVATAAAKQMTLVTYEVSSPFSKKRVMIPDACNALGVRYCDLNTVLKEMGIKI